MDETPFRPFDFDAPLDVTERLAALPRDRRVRGFVFNVVARRLGIDEPARTPFREYPLEDFVRLQARVGADGDGSRRLFQAGHDLAPAIRASVAGRVFFALAGDDLMRAGEYAERAWRLGVSFGDIHTEPRGATAFDVNARDVWAFHAYLVGTVTGMCEQFQPSVQVRYRRVSVSAFDLRVEW